MSRSNPTEGAPNPAIRWYEWNGEQGVVRYYDKELKQNINLDLPFTFMLLDQVGSVRGWHDASESGIYSNEVRDTRTDVLVVKSFKGGSLAEGVYRNIKDRVHTVGGQFVANCYIAFKMGAELAIGSIRFKGAALGAWMEFDKANRASRYEKAIAITGYTEGKKGRIVYRMPTFELKDLSASTNDQATALDVTLQTWMTDYFKRNTKQQLEPVADEHFEPQTPEPLTVDDIPFAWMLPILLPLALMGATLWA